jgi:hypothetical protein
LSEALGDDSWEGVLRGVNNAVDDQSAAATLVGIDDNLDLVMLVRRLLPAVEDIAESNKLQDGVPILDDFLAVGGRFDTRRLNNLQRDELAAILEPFGPEPLALSAPPRQRLLDPVTNLVFVS